jgi:hypothetical protein
MVAPDGWAKGGTLMSEQTTVYVAIAPKDKLEAGLAEKVAAIVKKDVRETGLVLGRKIPTIAGRYQNLQAAESVAQSLMSLGLVAIVCGDSEIRHPSSTRFRAHSLQLGDGEITFWDKGRRAKVVDANSVYLIIKGVLQSQTEKETTMTKAKLDIAATVLTGGIPIVRNIEEKSKNQSFETETFVRIYDRTSSEPVVEVHQRNFDYSGLGKKKAFSSLENLNVIVTELRNRVPQAVFDDRLMAHFRTDVPFATPEDEVEINCSLIYLFHRAVSGPAA